MPPKRGTTSCGRSPLLDLEFGRNLHIYGIVVPIGAGAIVRVGVIDLEQVVFAQSVVGRKAPVGFQSLPGRGIVAIAIPTAIHLQALAARNGSTGHRIPTVALVCATFRGAPVTVHIFAARLPTPPHT